VSKQPLPDSEVRERIETDLDANLCVEAAAGTGKTTVLVKRVVNLLASGRVRAEELVVITFTEKAAAELSTRVRDALEDRAAEAEPTERDRLLTAARELYRSHIETIHSFASALLLERPVEAPIDPRFEVLDELAAGLEFDAAYECFQDWLFSEPRDELELALRRGFTIKELRAACEAVNEHRYLLPLKLPKPVPEGLDDVVAQFGAIADELRKLLAASDPGDDPAVKHVESVIGWTDKLLTAANEMEQERLILSTSAWTNRNAGKKQNWPDGVMARVKDLQLEYTDLRDATRDTLRSNALLGLLPHIDEFARSNEAERKQAGRPDFDDLLIWARNMLRDSEPARSYFRRHLRAVLIDEFQDTDPVQAELALLLTSDEDPERRDWNTLKPAPGRLTVVGDPKQSIYRFRRADIAIYEEVKNGALAGGQQVIATNFRSNSDLLTGLNAIFDEVLKADPGVQPENVPLQKPPGGAGPRRPPIALATGTAEGDADTLRELEGRLIAGMLHAVRRDGWEIRDRRAGDEWRKCSWGDMAILLPARTGLDHYQTALAEAGIPYRHEGARDFFERQEVRDLVWVLSAIDDPTDRVALIGALRSSAFAISDEQLVIHAADAGTPNYRSPRMGPSAQVNDALAELYDLYKLRKRLSLAEMVRRTVERTHLVEFALTHPDGEQGAANLLAIVDQARMFAAAGGGGLRPFIRYLRESMAEPADEIDASVAEDTDDVVRLMTMHGAKGLEYPIVALANLGTQWSPKRSPVPREGEAFLHFRVGTKPPSGSGYFVTPGYDDVWGEEKKYEEAERLRLLYVAATRARDHLLVPCVVPRDEAGHLLGDLVHALPEDPQLVQEVDADKLVAPPREAEKAARPKAPEIAAAVRERERWAAHREDLMKRAEREREIENASMRERAQRPLAAEVSTFGAALVLGDGPPIAIGDAVHMVMERITLPDAPDLNEIAEDVCLEGDLPEELDDVLAMCRHCLKANSVRAAYAAERRWREVPFVLRDAVGAADGRNGSGDGTTGSDGVADDPFTGPLTTGRVDLVYQDGGELVVVDYKTDSGVTEENAEEHAREHHSGQSEVYEEALAAATGLPVREVVFVYCKAGVEVRFSKGEVVD
jgi:ATP-dependent exoDNAse (exonuclease V) beta subunit